MDPPVCQLSVQHVSEVGTLQPHVGTLQPQVGTLQPQVGTLQPQALCPRQLLTLTDPEVLPTCRRTRTHNDQESLGDTILKFPSLEI